jgi:hypothetical protein
MNASYDLNNLNVPNDDRITALTHLRIDSLTQSPEVFYEEGINYRHHRPGWKLPC